MLLISISGFALAVVVFLHCIQINRLTKELDTAQFSIAILTLYLKECDDKLDDMTNEEYIKHMVTSSYNKEGVNE